MSTLEMNGKLISTSVSIWYYIQSESYWKLRFWDINLKLGTQQLV